MGQLERFLDSINHIYGECTINYIHPSLPIFPIIAIYFIGSYKTSILLARPSWGSQSQLEFGNVGF